jgi:hypothetical protein
MKKLSICAVAVCLATPAFAQSIVPSQGFYAGLGGSVNSTHYNDQQITATGISDTYSTATGAKLASGTATGPAVSPSLGNETGIAPNLQAGYFRKFDNSNWLVGGKLSYSYINNQSTSPRFLVPQYGSFGTTSFTGNAVVQSYQVNVRQQVSLMPYVGYTFDRSYVYLGAGPTLSQVQTKINGVIGFADINGNRTDISGTPQNFSNTDWVWGVGATVGATYFLDSSWFIDVNYTIGTTQNKTANYNSAFRNVNANTGLTYAGSLVGTSSGSTTTQGFGITINKAF